MRVEGNRSSDDGPWVAPTGVDTLAQTCTCVSLVPLALKHHPGTADGTEKPLLPQMPLLFCST